MAKTKRYYWLKLKEDFFSDDTIEFLEDQENGKEYCLFYLKLCLKALRNNGVLIRSVGEVLIPYDAKKLAEITRTNYDTVVRAMQLFREIGLVQILDNGEIYLTQLAEMVGSETDKAAAMRRLRANNAASNNVTPMLPKCYTEIELEKEKEIELEKEQEEKEKGKPAKRFTPPTLEDVQLYCNEKGYNIEASRFIDYYTSNGWKVGKNSMKDWKAAVRTWERSASGKPAPKQGGGIMDDFNKMNEIIEDGLF